MHTKPQRRCLGSPCVLYTGAVHRPVITSRDISVGKEPVCKLDDTAKGKEIFPSRLCPDWLWCPTRLLFSGSWIVFFLG